jgi:gluconate 2-dehydrogenase alpha chain
MTRRAAHVDAVIVGLGWTGSIMGMELAEAGLQVLALERGPDQNTVPDFQYPGMIDELRYGVQYELMQKPRRSTVTIRHSTDQVALPYRALGAFLPGNGVGGAGTHWNGLFWRPQAEELKLKSYIAERWGKQIIPEDMTIGDFPVTYDELEPYFARFERVAGISGQAGNLNGRLIDGGNPFESWRSSDYPMPPMDVTWNGAKFAKVASEMGYHPFPRPGGIASTSYINEYGMQMAPCNYCGFCERYGCYQYSKSSPQTTILDALKAKPNFTYRVGAEVLRVESHPDGKSASGVTYFDEATGEQVFQPADIVILAAYQLHNVHLMLLSGIGAPYDPKTGSGVTGRNYGYQMTDGASLFFKNEHFNPFIGTGVNGVAIDDFGTNNLDFGKLGFIGGSYISSLQYNGQPIRSLPVPPGTPKWGAGWKRAIGEWYGHYMNVASHGSVMSYRGNYLDLDPTYRDRHGRPLMRMTFDWQPNDLRMNQYMQARIKEIVDRLNPDHSHSAFKSDGAKFDVRPSQSTHNTGGAIMADNPRDGPLNRYLQSWDMFNVFVMGANSFVQNSHYNPTGLVGGLAYWAAHHLRTQYLSKPRPLV